MCEHCGRKFNSKALDKHVKICQKVFSKLDKKKEDDDKQNSAKEQQSKKDDKNKWKMQSNQLRIAMKVARNDKGFENAVVPDVQTDLVECPHCNRTFNETAAAKHIPFCANQSKRNVLKKNDRRKSTNSDP